MIIRSIKVENFRPFLGLQEITFTNGVNIINAQQGGGKTSLFSAFYWCLFNKIYNSTDKVWVEDPSIINVINKQIVKKSEDEIRILCRVILEIEKRDDNEKIQKYFICRELSGIKSNNSLIDIKSELEILYYDDNGAVTITDRNADVFIEQYIFPKSLSEYIWFQGEFMYKLINLESSESFKRVIDTISYMDYYNKLVALINSAQSKNQISKSKKLKSNKEIEKVITDLTSNISYAQKRIDIIEENEIPRLIYDISVLDEKIRVVTSKISSNDMSKSLLGEIEKLNENYRKQIERREIIDEKYRSSLGNKWMLKGLNWHIQNADRKMHDFELDFSKAQTAVYELPIHTPDDNTLRDMLKAEMCLICGTSAPKGSKEFKQIEAKIGRAIDATKKLDPESQIIYKAINVLSRVPEDLLSALEEIDSDIQRLDDEEQIVSDEINIINSDRDKRLSERMDLERKLGVSNLQDWSTNMERNARDLITLDREKISKEGDKSRLEEELRTKKSELHRFNERINIIAHDAEEEIIEINIEKILNTLYDTIVDTKHIEYSKLVYEIQEKTNEYLLIALGRNNAIKVKIEIDPVTNIISRLDLNGNSIDLELNTGHDSLINLCIIMAIISKSTTYKNQSFSFLSDAPTSDLDPNVSLDWTYLNADVFEHSIILNKDLINFKSELINSNKISSVFELETVFSNEEGENGGIDSQYSRIVKIK